MLLAPLAGVSNRPFRVLAIKAGAALTYTEMVSSEGIIRNQQKTLSMMEFGPDEKPIAIQLFGANPEVMRQAAQIAVEKYGPDVIDINFGCPVKKVVNKNGGAAVLKDMDLTRDIIEATVEGAAGIPVTIKMRTGWDDANPVYIQAGQIAQKAGAGAITLHARSRAGAFSGRADWSAIKNLKDSVDIAVIGNGDINTPEDARRMFDETGCDAVMIGRAAMKNPLIFKHINHYLNTGEKLPEPTTKDKIELALEHARLMAEYYGEERGIKMMRRYLGWYVTGFHNATILRPKLFQVNTLANIEAIFREHLLR
ncbi:MAG: tRNA dihydrouridine synthase DusB [Candidatus Zixiibacteriota bacterium]|nr:MAG: tRNA dihydrouridine synthase DusB [candidate division Zixibacteria bacterium]